MTVKDSFNFKDLFKRASTYVGIVVTAGGSILAWYLQQPLEIQQTIPGWLIRGSSLLSLMGAVAVPLATSYKQKNIKE